MVVVQNRISEYRKKFALSQSELAEIVEVSKNCISAIERGSWYPSLKLALKIAFAFGVSVDTLFWLKGGASDA